MQDPKSRPMFQTMVSKLKGFCGDEFHNERFLAYQEKIKEFEKENIRISRDSKLQSEKANNTGE